ncbi:hypothetical protein SEVIR_7G257800v4 [Setaria viridis]|uniref:AAA+ ATPase domain-containing protein n=1 Tax=Setaria viridis TaxID=4556 RepID=A0A4U6U0E7_SETVI|nr:putative disease resistance protein RGA3 isoform X1 [Setaria viridis]XP_034604283.1 putative disease resistance protein RGA3 isoform X1 [Setaria viridis]XP_034604284.1 putative disease resistance protein RGA3 isoform X1 [Setaria viridis]XP_034604285.1 putative disease resistance protein RGA3 isoform X1 [Setaria viridis]TKW06709.1 hypothetical protein SEVIR_7G257800v2 [Setaria viridis]
MEVVAVSAARWVLGKALGSVADGLLEAWAASAGLGPNIDALKMELLYAQGMLDNAQGREIRSPALKEMLLKLQQLAYGADDVLDELEYFRIQDMLDGTYHAADVHDGGCIHGLTLNARHTARAIARKLKICSGSREGSRGDPDDGHEDDARQGCLSGICSCGRLAISSTPKSPSTQSDRYGGCMSKVASCARRAAHNVGKRLPCSSFPCVHNNAHSDMLDAGTFCSACQSKIKEGKHVVQTPKLKFDRVDISKKMKDIVEKLKPVSAKVSTILDMELLGSAILKLELLGSNTTTQKNAMGRPETTPDIIEPKLYGRDNQKRSLIDGITDGQYFANDLVVLPIVGPGGIGKTTFTQHVYDEVKKHFEVTIWICVSLNFNVSRLVQEVVRKIPKVDNEKENSSAQELIEQRLKTKRFLLVLDDMWTCQEDEWKKLIAPFGRGGEKGNVVIVTTRIPEVAEMVKTVDCSVQMDRLGDEDFMHFFEACVFGYHQPWKDCLELRLVGKKIVRNLKGFPLAAKTVGRLLRKQLTLDHWTSVLESKEWELQTNDNDIMPALKLSYDYLPFHLQQCFSYCSLFPEDYEFLNDELIHLWIGLDILHTCGQNKRTEDIARSYLVDLVNHGFLKRNEKDDGTPYYVVHDLLHNLAVKVSSYECISINSSNVRSIEIPISVRHLSIVVDDKEVENRVNFENFKKELRELDKRLNVENLRTLMLFGSHHGSYAKIFGHLFREARALRATYVSGASYNVEDMLHNFSKFVHLRYLRIKSPEYNNNDIQCLPAALSRLYHLEVIDLREWRGCFGFTRHMSNLEKLHHFLVPEHKLQLHSDIVEVGKMKLLQELRRFEVGKESKGFDLSELRQLSELGGSLAICSLERIQAMKEADEARLIQVKRLHKLTLEWGADRPEKDIAHEENALEILVPHSNLQHLCIKGHGGIKCPQWLGEKLSVKNLESLRLDGVAWNIFPPIGELWLVNGPHDEISSNVCNKKFQNLRRLELIKLPRLKKWAVDAPCQLFAHLEVLIIKDCSKLTKLSFAHSTCCQQEKEKGDNMNWFPSLRELEIYRCPELSSFPPIPWTSAPCSATIIGTSGLDNLYCGKYYKSKYRLSIYGTIDLDGTFWNMLAFGNLTELEDLSINNCPPLPLHHFHMLSSLKTLTLCGSSTIVTLIEGESRAEYQFPVEWMSISEWGASAKELTQLLTYFPKLSTLAVESCEKITVLGVVEKQATATPAVVAQIEQHQQQDGTRGEEEISAEGLLLLPSQSHLQNLRIWHCPELSLRSIPADYNREAGRTRGGQGLQGLTSLRSLQIFNCPRLLSSYSSSSASPCSPFPTSLEDLDLLGVVGMETLLRLSNLISLTDLSIHDCGDLRVEGLRPFLAHGRLTSLRVCGTPNFFAGSESSLPHEQEIPSSSSKLQELGTDDVAGVLAAPICALLSSSLTKLDFRWVEEVERFTKEQEETLQLLTSLESIEFWQCDKLQCLPAGLHRLPNLKSLDIHTCKAICSLPKDGLPGSLLELVIDYCPGIRSIHKECLPNSLQKLVIRGCPGIRSLPKVEYLPSSLRELDVGDNSEELRRHCRKLIGTIPIVRA